jgi:phage gp36-like protein
MSQYAQPSDLITVGITDATAARFGTASINAQLQAASAIADSYIVSQFELPLQIANPSAVPPLAQGWDMSLTLAVCQIAKYFLYSQFGFNPSGSPADTQIREGYERALKWLEQIRDKELFPQWIDATQEPTPEQAGPYVTSDTPVGFTEQGATPLPPGNQTNPFWPWW